MKKLPYINSKCNPVQSQQRMRSVLLKFGVDRISFDEDFSNFTILIKFRYRDYPVCIPINYDVLARVFQKADPFTGRKQSTKDEWEKRLRQKAYNAAFSIIEDFIKSMITMVELGAFSFEEIFVSYFIGPNGKRLGEYFKSKLPELVSGAPALTEGK